MNKRFIKRRFLEFRRILNNEESYNFIHFLAFDIFLTDLINEIKFWHRDPEFIRLFYFLRQRTYFLRYMLRDLAARHFHHYYNLRNFAVDFPTHYYSRRVLWYEVEQTMKKLKSFDPKVRKTFFHIVFLLGQILSIFFRIAKVIHPNVSNFQLKFLVLKAKFFCFFQHTSQLHELPFPNEEFFVF